MMEWLTKLFAKPWLKSTAYVCSQFFTGLVVSVLGNRLTEVLAAEGDRKWTKLADFLIGWNGVWLACMLVLHAATAIFIYHQATPHSLVGDAAAKKICALIDQAATMKEVKELLKARDLL